jgi:hypothetical protein
MHIFMDWQLNFTLEPLYLPQLQHGIMISDKFHKRKRQEKEKKRRINIGYTLKQLDYDLIYSCLI